MAAVSDRPVGAALNGRGQHKEDENEMTQEYGQSLWWCNRQTDLLKKELFFFLRNFSCSPTARPNNIFDFLKDGLGGKMRIGKEEWETIKRQVLIQILVQIVLIKVILTNNSDSSPKVTGHLWR